MESLHAIPRRSFGTVSHSIWACFRNPVSRVILFLLTGAFLLLITGCATSAGHTFVVNHPDDIQGDARYDGDANPGDGECTTIMDDTDCSLRAAIEEANALPGADSIHFNLPSNNSTIRLVAGGLPEIIEDVTIDGRTQPDYNLQILKIIQYPCDNGSACPLFSVKSGVSLTIRGLEIDGDFSGYSPSDNVFFWPESFFHNHGDLRLEEMNVHGAIYSEGLSGPAKLTMINSLITGSSIRAGMEALNTDVIISSSTIRQNGVQDLSVEAGGIVLRGGTATITETEIKENSGFYSGGMYIRGAKVHLDQCDVSQNLGNFAGGIYVEENGELWVESGWINGNHAYSDFMKHGGGIYSEGKIHISGSIIEDNTGSGIQIRFNQSSGTGLTDLLDVTNAQIMDNTRTGVESYWADIDLINTQIEQNHLGGVFLDHGSLAMTGGSVSNNHNNGGIAVDNANLDIHKATISGNDSLGSGGGVFGLGGSTSPYSISEVKIDKTTISGNTATDTGGGLYFSEESGTVAITNSTISGNRAGKSGGGLGTSLSSVSLNYVTLAGNTAPAAGGILGDSSVQVSNSILSQNSGGNCGATGIAGVISAGHNLDDDGTCGFVQPGDLSGRDAELGLLQNNGGDILTHALLSGSPAVDAADDSTCPKTDQRGIHRPIGAHCDIGAFESENSATATPPSRVTGIPTSTATPTFTPTPTWTPTPTPDEIVFDSVGFSSDIIYNRNARTCSPKEVTIEVKVSPAETVQSVGLFYRLEAKDSAQVTPWSIGYSMIPQGGGWYKLTIYSEDFPDVSKWKGDLWLAVQFVANGKDGQALAHSAVYRQVTVGQCKR